MKIALINASPKHKNSASGVILEELKELLAEHTVTEYGLHAPYLPESVRPEELARQDALVFVFPLYVDGIPSHFLRHLVRLEGFFRESGARPAVYAAVNCGFYEGRQNRLALEMMECWCGKAGLKWGRGVGIGAGGILSGGVPPEKGPRKNSSAALRELAENIAGLKSGPNRFVSPNLPRIVYKTAAEIGWGRKGKANGLKRKDLFRKR